MRNFCPSCQTAYALGPEDVGRRLACTKCQAVLVVGPEGLRLDEQPATPAVPSAKPSPRFAGLLRTVDLPTLAFGIGACVVLWFLFMPLVAKAHLERRQAVFSEAEAEHNAALSRLLGKGGDAARQQALEEDWNRRREELEGERKAAEFSAARSGYFDRYGSLAGFLLLAGGSVGMLAAGRSLVQRIVGAVVVTAFVLLVFKSTLDAARPPDPAPVIHLAPAAGK